MLTVTSSKFTYPVLTGNGFYKVVSKRDGEPNFVRKLRYFDEVTRTNMLFDATTSKTTELELAIAED